jgi:hypothetical protein
LSLDKLVRKIYMSGRFYVMYESDESGMAIPHP